MGMEECVKEGLRMLGKGGRKYAEEVLGLCRHIVRCSNPSSASCQLWDSGQVSQPLLDSASSTARQREHTPHRVMAGVPGECVLGPSQCLVPGEL